MSRDFVGYGRNVPQANWPNRARLALSIAINYEEGAEMSFGLGDLTQETYREYPKTLPAGVRDLINESSYEYGARVGLWRILDLLDHHKVTTTFFACAAALEQHPEAGRAIVKAGHEICSHGYRWQEPFTMTEEEERASIAQAVASITRITGSRPVGWYSRYSPSIHTRRLLVEAGGFLYDSDSVADDTPFYDTVDGRPFLVLPYSLDANDMKFWMTPAFANSEDFLGYLRDAFDVLYEEGTTLSRMMSVGIHLRVSGRPGRIKALERFLEHVQTRGDVWIARREEIARWWLDQHPPER